MSLDALETVRGTSSVLALSQENTAWAEQAGSCPLLCRKGKMVSECSASPAVLDIAGETCLLQQHPGY